MTPTRALLNQMGFLETPQYFPARIPTWGPPKTYSQAWGIMPSLLSFNAPRVFNTGAQNPTSIKSSSGPNVFAGFRSMTSRFG